MRSQLYKGEVRDYFEDKGYGFITSIEYPDGLFFHRSQCINQVETEDPVVFEFQRYRGRGEAGYVRKIFRSANDISMIEGVKATIVPQVREVLYDVLPEIELDVTKDEIRLEHRLDKKQWDQLCVETDPGDKIIYARRADKGSYMKFVLEKKPVKTDILSIILKKVEGFYMIVTAFFGPLTQPFPWDKNADPELSGEFWQEHALVLNGAYALDPRSFTGFLPEELEKYF